MPTHRESSHCCEWALLSRNRSNLKKSDSPLMWHPALFQREESSESSSSFLEAVSSSSAPEGRGEQHDRPTASQLVGKGDASQEERGQRQVTAVSAGCCHRPCPSTGNGAAHPFAKDKKANGDGGFTGQMCGRGRKRSGSYEGISKFHRHWFHRKTTTATTTN